MVSLVTVSGFTLRFHVGMFFQHLGTDIDIDSNLKPWFIESNVNPSLIETVKWSVNDTFDQLQEMLDILQIRGNNISTTRNNIMQRYTFFIHSYINIINRVLHILDEFPLSNAVSLTDVEMIVDTEYEVGFFLFW